VGVMGELDVRMTAELFGGEPLARALAPEWDGGMYYAAQRKSATAAEKDTTASIALLYTSHWKNKNSARSFFDVFEQELPRQYEGLKRRDTDEKSDDERVYSTGEGDVLLTLKDNTVWVSEGFDLALARKLRDAVDVVNAPLGNGPVMQARTLHPNHDLVGGLIDTVSQFGTIKAVLR
jgi:imidazole glycerol phosphate synthase subunit HisF